MKAKYIPFNLLMKFYGCTSEKLFQILESNAADLRKNVEKATATGKKVDGYTAAQWKCLLDIKEMQIREGREVIIEVAA